MTKREPERWLHLYHPTRQNPYEYKSYTKNDDASSPGTISFDLNQLVRLLQSDEKVTRS